MTGQPVLVTGGAGYIGSHTCKALARQGWIPVTLDNLSRGHAEAVRWGPLVRADVRDRAAVAAAIREHGIRTVLHFAAYAYVGESVAEPLLYYDNNVAGMISLLEAAAETGVSGIVFSSSCATYGHPDRIPVAETAPQNPLSPYGRTKLFCERILEDNAAAGGPRFVSLRYFNAAGTDPEGELAERHYPETHLIPLALQAASGAGPELTIFGNDYDTPDGTCIRDYIHVTDLAEAHVRAVAHLEGGGGSVAVNLGSGKGHSVLEVLETIARVTGRPVPARFGPRRPGDPAQLFADPTLARQVLGFATRRSDLRTIIADAAPSFGLKVLDEAPG
ncbi:MAG: UDP-glucose 4-epimerase GalE [Alphaproteobacteria bacterium]|nr:MAG: UDP-glucose 4-epimerase GalE [Alphaproteobacteria bacterium]